MLCSSWDIVCVGCNCYCSFWVIFSPFPPLTAQKMRTWKKHREISFNTSVPKILIICYTVPEIWCVTDVTAIFHLGYFLPFYPSNSLKKENFKKNEKNKNKKIKINPPKTTTTTTIAWRYHHFTQVYQKSWSYAILFLRYMVCDGCNCYFSFWAIFCPFTTLTAPKIKIKKKKNHLEISWSYAILFLRYMVCDGCSCYFSFWAIFLPFYKNSPKNQNFKKKKQKNTHTHTDTHTQHKTNKKHLEIWSYTCVPKTMIRWSMVPEIWCTTDRQTDRQTDRKSGI